MLQKCPVNACDVRDGLSGDMLASSWRNLVANIKGIFSVKKFSTYNDYNIMSDFMYV